MDNFQQYSEGISYRLIDLMRERNLSKIDLAARLGVSYKTAHRYVSGPNHFSIERLLTIAQALGVPVARLLPEGDVKN